MNYARQSPLKTIAWSLLTGLAAIFWAVVAWIAFLSLVSAGDPPTTPQCRHLHDGEILVSATHRPDGTINCQYVDESQIYGRARKEREVK